MHGQGTVTICVPRNAGFACFPMVLKDFGKPFADLGNHLRSSVDVHAETQGISMLFARFQRNALLRLAPVGFVPYIAQTPSTNALTCSSILQ